MFKDRIEISFFFSACMVNPLRGLKGCSELHGFSVALMHYVILLVQLHKEDAKKVLITHQCHVGLGSFFAHFF